MTVPAPRVIEESQTQVGVPRPQPTRPGASPTAAPPTPVPTPIAAPAASPLAALPPSAAEGHNPERARQRLDDWLSRPAEERAHAAMPFARWANRIALEHPDNPRVQQMKRDLPALLRGETIGAIDGRQPFLANPSTAPTSPSPSLPLTRTSPAA